MSINHYSPSLDLPETTLWWTHQNPQHQQQQNIQIMEPIPNPSWPLHHHKNLFNLNNNNNNEEDEEFEDQVQQDEQATSSQEQDEEQQQEEDDKEPMFEKPLTPSDVGKLNRLVIPKQHAEKYFPLGAASAASASAVTSTTASDSGECKGLLLSFEDESGKCWRFRYSYWNSSQSYVLTKGWSRYVKDKRLDAGDIVSFERHRSDSQRLFIRWRRRSADAAATAAQVSRAGHGGGDGSNNGKSGGGGAGGVGWTSGFYCAQPSYPTHHQQQQHQLAYHQQHEDLHAGKVSQVLNQRTRPILGNCSSSNSKVLRLFGVNMECQTQQDDDDDDSTTPQCSYNNVVMPSTHAANNNNNNTNHHNLYNINQHPNSHMLHQQPYYY